MITRILGEGIYCVAVKLAERQATVNTVTSETAFFSVAARALLVRPAYRHVRTLTRVFSQAGSQNIFLVLK